MILEERVMINMMNNKKETFKMFAKLFIEGTTSDNNTGANKLQQMFYTENNVKATTMDSFGSYMSQCKKQMMVTLIAQ